MDAARLITPIHARLRACCHRCAPPAQRGSAYLAMLVAVVVAGIFLGITGQVWHTLMQREKEAELLFVGNQYREALNSYFLRTPEGAGQYPERLEDLLLDARFPMPVRHLRRLYPDPMSGEADWVEVRANGRIVAVHSRSQRRSLREHFEERDGAFAGTTTHGEWVFHAAPQPPPGRPR